MVLLNDHRIDLRYYTEKHIICFTIAASRSDATFISFRVDAKQKDMVLLCTFARFDSIADL